MNRLRKYVEAVAGEQTRTVHAMNPSMLPVPATGSIRHEDYFFNAGAVLEDPDF